MLVIIVFESDLFTAMKCKFLLGESHLCKVTDSKQVLSLLNIRHAALNGIFLNFLIRLL